MKRRSGSYVILSLIFLILGFMVSYSVQYASEWNRNSSGNEQRWTQEYKYRKLIIEQKQNNSILQKSLLEKQYKVSEIESEIAKEKEEYSKLLSKLDKYRLFNGDLSVKGSGVEVTLTDSSYIPSNDDVNNYLVHDQHLHMLVNEMFVSGANAVAINGQRLTKNSYISCIGPVVTVDGNEHPAPFIITAIGDASVLEKSLKLKNGVLDQIKTDNVDVRFRITNSLMMDPAFKRKKQD
ncbi:MAG: hypothetical protein K0S34_876 [Bacillales bacterium]|nr:hypothetical protein [Bacillales bacterium]